jgi:hypothetical protein
MTVMTLVPVEAEAQERVVPSVEQRSEGGLRMIARVLRVQVPPENVEAIVTAYREDVRPIHARAEGLRHHYVLVDRTTGQIQIIGVGDSAEAVTAIAPLLEPARQRLWAQFCTNPPLEVFEVADELSSGGRVEPP